MANDILQEVACPNCRNSIDLREHGQHVVCDACGSRFLLRGHLCPNCNTYHSNPKPFCGACGTAMERVCRKCGTNNWAGDEYCVHCGRALDIFELLALQHKDARQQQMARRREQIRSLREQEAAASQKRMADLEGVAATHQKEVQRRLALKRAQEKRMLLIALTAVAIFLLIVLAYTLVTFLVT